jgi:thioredoxin-dependent peroxiredoxin
MQFASHLFSALWFRALINGSKVGPQMEEDSVVGRRAPNFTLKDQNERPFTFFDSQAPAVVLFFYPKDYSPICTVEAIAFREAYANFAALGAEVIGVSSDSSVVHAKFCQSYELPFRLLSDPGHSVRNLFGAINSMGFTAGRVTFVVDRERVIRHVFVAEFRATRHVREALRVVREICLGSQPLAEPLIEFEVDPVQRAISGEYPQLFV